MAGTGDDAGFVAACRAVLARLQAECDGLQWVGLTSRDGMEIVSTQHESHEKLSVMGGTLQALADGIAHEATIGGCHDIIIGAQNGRFIVLSVRDRANRLVIAGLTTERTSLGLALALFSACCREIAALADSPPVQTPVHTLYNPVG